MNKKIKILLLTFSYLFFLFVIFLSFNAVIPEDDLVILETKKPIIKKIENNFKNDEDSIYQILNEENKLEQETKITKIDEFEYSKKDLEQTIQQFSNISDPENNEKYHIQFISFKSHEKSISASKTLQKKLKKDKFKFILSVKKKIINGTNFFRVVSSESFSLNKGRSLCEKLKKKKYNCIIVKL